MERGAAGAAPKNDGGKAATRRVQARAAAAGNSEEGARGRGEGKGGNPPPALPPARTVCRCYPVADLCTKASSFAFSR